MDPTPGVLSLGERINEVISLALSPASFLPIAAPGTPRRRLVDGSARLEADLRAVIADKRAAGAAGDDVLATLLATHDEEGAALTDDELLGQLFILFLASHDTTKNAIAWTLFLLAQHPAVLREVVDEIRGALGGGPPSTADLAKMPLLERVIKESLRLFPPAPLTARLMVQPAALGGVDFPAGTEVILSPYNLHRYPDLYPDPARFSPARWEALSPSPFEYAPFGAGPRSCIGAGFAMMELKTVLSMLLQRFGVALPPGARIDRRTTVVMTPRHGMPMTLLPAGEIARPSPVRGDVREMVDLPS
jgi:cytochrome P450